MINTAIILEEPMGNYDVVFGLTLGKFRYIRVNQEGYFGLTSAVLVLKWMVKLQHGQRVLN